MTGSGHTILLSARDLTRRFHRKSAASGRTGREVQALRGVSLDVREGEWLALVGESGSGKTTLARCLLRLLEPSSGNLFFRGRDVLSMDRKELREFRKKVQIVFQDPFGSLKPRARAGAMLEESLRVHRGPEWTRGERRERVGELLHLVGLRASHGDRYPHELSGGQRQRLGIARALSVEPELIVLDEPVSALDLSVQIQILNLLEDLRERLGLTLLLIAHDLTVVRQVADRVAVLYMGQMVEVASVNALFEDPIHPYTKGLLSAASAGWQPRPGRGEAPTTRRADRLSASPWRVLPGRIPRAADGSEGCSFYSRCPHPEKDEQCARKRPELVGPAEGRRAACWKETPALRRYLTRF